MNNKKLQSVRIETDTWLKIKLAAVARGIAIGEYIKEIVDGCEKK